MAKRDGSFDVVSGFVDGPPHRLQIAHEGDWMNAWRFAQDATPSSDALKAELSGRGRDVAVEFCFTLSTGEEFFFGQRRLGEPDDPGTALFVERALACGAGRDWAGLPDFLSRLERVTSEAERIGEVGLCGDLANVEIGITDWWRRGDVVEVWDKAAGTVPDRDRLDGRMRAYPSLMRNDINFVCLEFNFPSPVHHWFGIEISARRGGAHELDTGKAHAWLARCRSGSAGLTRAAP